MTKMNDDGGLIGMRTEDLRVQALKIRWESTKIRCFPGNWYRIKKTKKMKDRLHIEFWYQRVRHRL